MGCGCTLKCTGCGYEMNLSVGPGFLSNPFNKETRRDVLSGKYGPRPRKVLEENPKAECSWYMALFHCKCGNYCSKDAVVISEMGKYLYRPSRRCNLCHGKMWEVSELPYCPLCPKCRFVMEETDCILWD